MLESLITENLKSKLFLLPGHVDIAARIRELDLPSLDVPNLFQIGPLTSEPASAPLPTNTSPSSPKIKLLQQDAAVTGVAARVSWASLASSKEADDNVPENRATAAEWKQVSARRSSFSVSSTPTKRFLDPNIVSLNHSKFPCA
jgi:hypothetical protein